MAGVFGLKTTYKKQVKDIWTSYDPQYGYIFSSSTQIDQYDFNNGTSKLSDISLSLQQTSVSGMVGREHAYAVGGYSTLVSPNYISSVDRIDFTTHARASVSGLDTTNWWTSNRINCQNATMSSIKYGYGMACHGYSSSGGGGLNRDNALVYSTSNETLSSDIFFPSPNPPDGTVLTNTAAVEAPNQSKFEFGYISGGYGRIPPSNPNAYRNIIRKLDFSTKVNSVLSGVLSNDKAEHSGASSKEHAYFFAGMGYSNSFNSVNKVEFSSDTVSPSTSFPVNLRNGGAFPDGNNFAYIVGGKPTYNAANNTTNIYRFDYSNSTYALRDEKISAEAAAVTAFAESPRKPITKFSEILGSKHGKKLTQYGYFGGGANPTPSKFTSIDRLDVSNETVVQLTNSNFTEARYYSEGLFSSHYGYFCGGSGSGLHGSNITRIDFSNEVTRENDSFQVPTSVGSSGYFNTPTYGYIAGGIRSTSPAYPKSIDKLDYSTETFSSGGDLSAQKAWTASFTTPNSGFVCGGYYQPNNTHTASIDRFDFSTGTADFAPYSFPMARRSQIGLSSNEYGYVSGGSNPTFVYGESYRIDYNADTMSYNGGFTGMKDGASFNSTNYGYIATGNDQPTPTNAGGSPTIMSKIFRMEYHTETRSSSTGINLSQAKHHIGGLSN